MRRLIVVCLDAITEACFDFFDDNVTAPSRAQA